MPSTTVTQTKLGNESFYELPLDYLRYIEGTYITPGRLTITKTPGSDGQTETSVFTFATEADRAAYLADPNVIAQTTALLAHNRQASINFDSDLPQ